MSILPFEISFDFSWITYLGDKPLWYLLWYFFINGGWILFALVCIWGGFEYFVFTRRVAFSKKAKYVFLALDIPRQNLQSPMAVENIFSTLAGAHSPLEWEEKVFQGAFQLGFSLEIVSIDGFIQYVIRTPIQWRDMLESAIYSQYPDAEITEVEDYAAQYKDIRFPHDEYKIWGADLTLYNKEYFPIRTYPYFEHSQTKDFKDPLTTLLEVMNKMKPGEQFWLQFLIYPADLGWEKAGKDAIKKLVGQPVDVKQSALDKALDAPVVWLNDAGSQILGAMGFGDEPAQKEDKKGLPFLPPVEKEQAEAIFRKISKIGFDCKARMVYFGKKEVFNKGLGVSGTFGAIKQFSDLNLNGFKPDKNKTQARWPWFKEYRTKVKQNNILQAYISRDSATGSKKFILNIEELATLYHFPYFEIKGPVMKRIESKKVIAPVGLPTVDGGIGLPTVKTVKTEKEYKKGDKIPVVDFEDDYFEKRFAVDKSGEADKERKAKIMRDLEQKGSIKQPEQPIPEPTIPEINQEEDELDTKFAKEDDKPSSGDGTGAPPSNLPTV